MAWKKHQVNKYAVYTERLTVSASNADNQDLTSSAIDFIPPGTDFVVIANYGATDLSSDADIAIKVQPISKTGTYGLLKDDLIASIDEVVAAAVYDVSSYGEAPYYKVFVDSDGVQKSADTVDIAIIIGAEKKPTS